MNYGLVNKIDAISYARAACNVLGGGKNPESTVALLVETAAAETLLGITKTLRQPAPERASRKSIKAPLNGYAINTRARRWPAAC